MYNINQVTIEHIQHLDALGLSKVLHRLLMLEATANNIVSANSSVAFNITSGDAGNDGKMEWTGSPLNTKWLKKQCNLFQNKATSLFPANCFEELLIPKSKEEIKENPSRQLKAEVEKVVDQDGSYVLFTSKPLTDSSKAERIAEFRKAIKKAGKPNHASMSIEVYDANKIKDWVNEHLASVTLVQKLNDIHRPAGFRDWDELSIDIEAGKTPYQQNAVTEANIKLIQDSIEEQKIIRVTGHSGLGKTRLILETFRDRDAASNALKQQFVYYDAGSTQNVSEIATYIIDHRNSQSGIIVVDNCSLDGHNKLSKLVKHQGCLKVVTVGLDDESMFEDAKIKLSRDNQRDLVKNIVENKLRHTHTAADIEYVANLSEGYPWMAVRFCKAILEQGIADFNKFLPEEALQKLLFGTRATDKQEYEIIRACSVFSAFGFLDDSFTTVFNKQYQDSLKKQTEFIRTQVCDSEVSETAFREACLKFKNEDIIQQLGTFLIVKPTVLAIHLAAQWLTVTPPEKIKKIIEHLKENNLEQKFLERLVDLDQLDKAKSIVEELWGDRSFFGSAEVLNTSWGSLLFRYVVEVNPESTVSTLVRAFGKASKEELHTATEGRRNLVWALEKLCFRKETFFDAATILFSFAVAENESWANNATHQVAQLFQRFLAGTEADYGERIAILDWALKKDDADYNRIAIQCMGRAFIPAGNHIRGGGAEKQGSSAPLVDFQPKTWEEIDLYWKNLLDKLVVLSGKGDENAGAAKQAVLNSVRTLLQDNHAEFAVDSVRAIYRIDPAIWQDALAVFRALAYEKYISPKGLEQVNALLAELTPQNLHDQFMMKVVRASYDYDYKKDEQGNYLDSQRLRAEEFAQYLTDHDIAWDEEIAHLVRGEQRQTLNFSRRVAELGGNVQTLLDRGFEELLKVPPEEQDSQFIIGLLLGAKNDKLFMDTLDRFGEYSVVTPHVFNMVRLYPSGYPAFQKLVDLLDRKAISISNFNSLKFGSPLSGLKDEEVNEFCNRIAVHGSTGQWIAFAILFMNTYHNEPKWKAHQNLIRSLIKGENLLKDENFGNREPFYWGTAVRKLLTDSQDDELAKAVAEQIVEFCNEEWFRYGYDTYMSEVIRLLFGKYFKATWSVISKAIAGDPVTYLHIKHFVGSQNGWTERVGAMFANPSVFPTIYDWAKENPVGKLRVAYMMPLGEQVSVMDDETGETTTEVDWHPFTKGFIDLFGDDEKVLNELSANMGSFGSVGSSVPYFVTQKQLLQKLVRHPLHTVRSWVKEMLVYTEKNIKFESLSDQQRSLE